MSRQAGGLYEKVIFDQPTAGDDGQGGLYTAGWTEMFTVRANYRRLRGSETVLAARLEGRQPTIIKIRCSSDSEQITTDWRIRDARNEDGSTASWTDDQWSSEVFNIRSIIKSDDRLYYDITAESGVAI